jgi:two-component system sensor histidine kinase ChiS
VLDVALGDHIERNMAVLFTDMRGFTATSERLSSQATFDLLNAYFARAGPVIRAHGGFIDKYVGDAIVALFPNRPSDALDAAIAVQSEVRRFNEDRARRGEEPIAVGIGVNYGSMMLGTVGESERYETTVIADSVNIASRLEGLTKVYGVSIIVSGALVDTLDDPNAYSLRALGEVELRGHQRNERAYEVFDGDAHDVMLQKRRLLDEFSGALAAYTDGDYEVSYERFAKIVAASPGDAAAAYLRDRSAARRDAPVPAE